MVKPGEQEIIIPPKSDRPPALETRQAIERLRQHCLVELKAVRQLHEWLEDKRSCRQVSSITINVVDLAIGVA